MTNLLKETKAKKAKKPFYKKWYTWTAAIIIIGALNMGGEEEATPAVQEIEPVTTEAAEPTAAPKEEPKEAAPVVEDNTPKEFKSALKKAETYAKTMDMSKAAIHDQLTSEYGEKFSVEAADYAMSNLEFDWNANALSKAKTYQDTMDMSVEAIRDQLTSEFGEKFTQAEADYAINNLDK